MGGNLARKSKKEGNMFIRSAQSSNIPVPQQAPAVPLQTTTVPAQTTEFDMTTMMNMIMMLIFMVIMVRMVSKVSESV